MLLRCWWYIIATEWHLMVHHYSWEAFHITRCADYSCPRLAGFPPPDRFSRLHPSGTCGEQYHFLWVKFDSLIWHFHSNVQHDLTVCIRVFNEFGLLRVKAKNSPRLRDIAYSLIILEDSNKCCNEPYCQSNTHRTKQYVYLSCASTAIGCI